jgi:hypothetical protein
MSEQTINKSEKIKSNKDVEIIDTGECVRLIEN